MKQESISILTYELESAIILNIKQAYGRIKTESNTLDELETGIDHLVNELNKQSNALGDLTREGMVILLKKEMEEMHMNDEMLEEIDTALDECIKKLRNATTGREIRTFITEYEELMLKKSDGVGKLFLKNEKKRPEEELNLAKQGFKYAQEQAEFAKEGLEAAKMKVKDAKKQSRQALYWSLAALVVSVIALVIQILG